MKSVLVNPNSQILRSGWRIVLFLVFFMAINITVMFLTRTALGSLPAEGTLWWFILGLSATIAAFITSKYISKRSFKSFGLKGAYAIRDVIIGVLISAIVMLCTYFTLLYLGHIQFQGFSFWKDEMHSITNFSYASLMSACAVLFQFLIVAWWEELAFRGVILQYLAEGLNLKWGVILSTLFFGIVHAGNPNATALSTILIMIITLKLVYAYLKTGQLWLPIGLHLGWNYFQASVFGFASSGHYSPSLISQTPISADWLSGGDFGAENSVFIIPFTLLAFYLVHLWVKQSRKLKSFKITDYLIKSSDFKKQAKTLGNFARHS